MDIPYSVRSNFLTEYEAGVCRGSVELRRGHTVRIESIEGGYSGRIWVAIDPGNRSSFSTSWRSSDPTRFPARIKAAATALLNEGFRGEFEIAHEDGMLTIRAAETHESESSTVYLVSCVSKKRHEASPARDLYDSSWFKKARTYADESGCRWFVLSAQYGLVEPEAVIAPYEKTLNRMAIEDRRAWAQAVYQSLIARAPSISRVVFLAGERYREFLAPQLKAAGIASVVPMQGLRIGEQLGWLSRNCP